MKDSIARTAHIFKSIETMHGDSFTDRELEIIESMEVRFEAMGYISNKSLELLEQIYKRGQGR